MAKLKIKTKISTIFIILAIYSCEHTSQKIETPIIPTPNFVLSENERKLLYSDPCSDEINMDTVKSTLNFRNALIKFYKNKNKENDEICISFGFIANDSITIKRLKFQYKVPYPYTSGGGISLSNYHYLFVDVSDNKIDIVSPNRVYSQNIKKLNEYITQIYKKPLDSTNFLNVKDVKKRLIRISFLSDSMNIINQTLSQLIIGYIIAQRELCKEYFKKDINEASINEIIELRTKNPFVFKLGIDKRNKEQLNPKLVTSKPETRN